MPFLQTHQKSLPLRLIFAAVLIAGIASIFWTQSRYPDLNHKAMMSGALILEDPLSYEALIPVERSANTALKILQTTANWISTNLKGMTFGILFGAAFLTLLRYLPKLPVNGRFSNSAFGMIVGAPLGVCVNCAAPVAKGFYSGGARAEFTLSAMIASPTLNIIVVTMAFSILPFEIALLKVILSLAVILIVVPLIVRFTSGEMKPPSRVADKTCALPEMRANDETFGVALVGFVRDYARDLWFILYYTAPFMILAGLLGATVGTLVPLDMFSGAQGTLLVLIAAAIIGIFLPVPMGFDVVVAGTLLVAGMPVGMVMTLVFTLGIFSVYSFIIIGNTISWRVARNLVAAIIILAVPAGLAVQSFHEYQVDRAIALLTQ